MSHLNWPYLQPGRGNFGRGNYERGSYPRHPGPNNQGPVNEWHLFHSQGIPFYQEQGQGYGPFMGGGHVLHPANSQWGRPFFEAQGRGFGDYYMGGGNESHLGNNQWGRPFYGEQGHSLIGYHGGHEYQPHPANSQRGGPFYPWQGGGFGYVGNDHQLHPFNRGGPSYRERGRGFGHVGNGQPSRGAHHQRGGISHIERGGSRGFGNLNVGNAGESRAANDDRKSFNRKQENEQDSNHSGSQRERLFDKERGPSFDYNGENKHESNAPNSAMDKHPDGKQANVRKVHESHPAKTERSDSPSGKQGRDLSQRGRGRGQDPKDNRGRHCTRGGSRDSGGSWRSGLTAPRPSSTPEPRPSKKEKAVNDVVPKPTSIPRNRFDEKKRSNVNQAVPKLASISRNHPNKREKPVNQAEPTSIPRSNNSKKERPMKASITGSHIDTREKPVMHVKPNPTSNLGNDLNEKSRSVNDAILEQKYLDFPFIEHADTVRLLPQFLVMFILRGLPGSGKTTIANAILKENGDDVVVCSANFFHYNEDGEYVFDPSRLQEAHSTCQKHAKQYADLKKPIIVIDNTNVKISEMDPYIGYARQRGYVVVLVEPRTPWKRIATELKAKSTHDVPLATIRKRLDQYENIVPAIYFAWFVSPAHHEELQKMAKDVLMKCLQVTDFQQCIEKFAGHSSSEFTIDDALSYYSIEHSNSANLYHVTACYSPPTSYHKSPAVEKACGEISQLSIVGCVVTKDTFSAQVLLTSKQQELWKNDNVQTASQQRGNPGHRAHYIQGMTRSFQRFDINKKSERPEHFTHASTHITLGTRRGAAPVQSKYDVQTVANHEISSEVFEKHTLPDDIGTAKKYSDTMWAVHFKEARAVPAIFSGYYDQSLSDVEF